MAIGPCVVAALAVAPVRAESDPRRPSDAELDARMQRVARDAVERMTGAEAVPQLAYDAALAEQRAAYPDARFEEVQVPVPGLRLTAWMVKPPADVPIRATVLVLHPWQSNRAFGLAQYGFLLEYGYQLFIPDARSNAFIGRADAYNAYVREDMEDLSGMMRYLERRPDVSDLVAYGCAWGGMKAILLGARFPRVRAVIADAPTLHYGLILVDYMNKMPPSVRQDWTVINRYIEAVESLLKERVGYGLEDYDPRSAIRRLSPRPVLLLHGKDDVFVPIQVSEQLVQEAREPKRLVRGDAFGHCEGMHKDPGRYIPRVLLFLERALR
jgi:hypothetical protein